MSDIKPEIGGKQGYLRIATEEAFAPPEMMSLYLKMIENKEIDDPGFLSLWGFYGRSPSPRARWIMSKLQSLGDDRIADMNERGIDKQVIALTAPGTHILKSDIAVEIARLANDQLAQACRDHPHRYVGMTAIATQNPAEAVKEIERGANRLGFRAVIINSHVNGRYLDDQAFWQIFEAAEACDMPIYLHPNSPPRQMIQPFLEAGLDGAIFGFGVDTGLHALRLITSGVFDMFPKLKIILGHMGEALPFWQYRIDFMHQATVNSKRYEMLKPLKRLPSDYLRDNFYITNSGVAWAPAIKFTQSTQGVDKVLYAMDYPYQCDVSEVVALDNMDMPEADKKAFFQTNAERIFKL